LINLNILVQFLNWGGQLSPFPPHGYAPGLNPARLISLPSTTSGPLCHACTSRGCLANLYWGIQDTWPNQPCWDFSIRRNGSTFVVLRIWQLRTLSRSVAPWTLRKNPVSAAWTSD